MMTSARDPSTGNARTARKPRAAKTAKTKLGGLVVVCAKCAKRQGVSARAVRSLLKDAAKRAAKRADKRADKRAAAEGRSGGRGKLRILETGCLGPCPKHAVAVATGASLAAGRVILLDLDAEPDDALAAVLAPVLSRHELPAFGPNTGLAAMPTDELPPGA